MTNSSSQANPLLTNAALPPFDAIKTEYMAAAIESLLQQNRDALQRQLAELGAVSWQRLVAPLEERDTRLGNAWAPISHLNGVMNSAELRDVYNRCLAQLTGYSTELSQNEDLFRAYQALAESNEFATLDTAQRKTITNALRDFRLAGVDLPPSSKKRYADIKQRLSELSTRFSNNVLDATQGWYKHIEHEQALAGLPASALAGAQQAAQQRGLTGYVLTLDGPAYLAVMTHADDRALRAEVYRAFVTRASDQGMAVNGKETKQWDNQPVMQEILALRHELAQLLGFAHYADYSLATKMAKSSDEVLAFLTRLADASRAAAQQEFADLREFAQSQYGVDELMAWDVAYYSEKYRQKLYAIAEEELRPYFPVEQVKRGLFDIAARLFNINIEKDPGVSTWHKDAEYYRIQRGGRHIAGFYLDLYARENKRGGAWMAECRARCLTADGLQLPIAFLTCNFSAPTATVPSLLTHSEVRTLFHEFGHGLHHMLTQINCTAVGGINGVAWDAVELPSQFLENWCWEEMVIPLISSHYQTQQPLPADMLAKLLRARNFQSAMQMVRQLEFALFDFRLHAEYDAALPCDPQTLLDEVRSQVAVLQPPGFNKFQNSFTHIFGGGYAAGYYSYKWAEVLSADAFSLFEENGIFDAGTAQSFLRNILEKGGSEDAMDLFVKFRGREPSVEALLRHSGIVA